MELYILLEAFTTPLALIIPSSPSQHSAHSPVTAVNKSSCSYLLICLMSGSPNRLCAPGAGGGTGAAMTESHSLLCSRRPFNIVAKTWIMERATWVQILPPPFISSVMLDNF